MQNTLVEQTIDLKVGAQVMLVKVSHEQVSLE